jgi:peptidoglycan/xylan/chitin deacetylase (PgdA/CDA1 family)
MTVDDGGVSFHTTICDRLERRGWRAHCFVTTRFIGTRGFLGKEQIRDLDGRGHVIGTHSASHPPRLSYQNREDIVREWRESREALADLLKHDVKVASVPGGYFSGRVARAAKEAGIDVLFTSEPELRVRSIGGCIVLGRFTVRRDHESSFGNLDGRIRAREWIRWKTRKAIKTVFVDPVRSLRRAM